MPKIISGLQEQILEEGKKLLFEKGYRALTMRTVADRCGIAIGTTYNYYKSKDVLIANIMLVDWQKEMQLCAEDMAGEKRQEKKAEIVFNHIRKFSREYESIWYQYAGSSHGRVDADRHTMLVKQLCEISGLSCFVIEVILHFTSLQDVEYMDIKDNLKKVLKEN